MSDAAIEIAPYDPAWPAKFAREAAVLSPLLAPWMTGPIEHVGSTAVPGLLAKPVIDIMVPVRSLEDSVELINAVATVDYLYSPYRADVMHWFCKPSPAHRTHHLHAVPRDSELWRERLAFRDALRSDPELAARYGELKMLLAQRHARDRDAYTEAKTSFIKSVVRRSLA